MFDLAENESGASLVPGGTPGQPKGETSREIALRRGEGMPLRARRRAERRRVQMHACQNRIIPPAPPTERLRRLTCATRTPLARGPRTCPRRAHYATDVQYGERALITSGACSVRRRGSERRGVNPTGIAVCSFTQTSVPIHEILAA